MSSMEEVGSIFIFYKGDSILMVPDLMGNFGAGISAASSINLFPREWTAVPINDKLRESMASGALRDLDRRRLLAFANSRTEADALTPTLLSQMDKEKQQQGHRVVKEKPVKALTPAEIQDLRARGIIQPGENVVEAVRKYQESLEPAQEEPQDAPESIFTPPVAPVPQNGDMQALNAKMDVLIGAMTQLVGVMTSKQEQTPATPVKRGRGRPKKVK